MTPQELRQRLIEAIQQNDLQQAVDLVAVYNTSPHIEVISFVYENGERSYETKFTHPQYGNETIKTEPYPKTKEETLIEFTQHLDKYWYLPDNPEEDNDSATIIVSEVLSKHQFNRGNGKIAFIGIGVLLLSITFLMKK